ncbi:methyl-accepting chemotaxis protein [Oryzisolibacter propanilivorax]|uniref:Methyl-accepting chemotaxis protein n=1 Tax=Oryzisolibacter propanilivorax TaxID=1527607 RepID=A0A1G9QEJ3_9BURK|nr:methyl-accepting chemotaxis protein [Oryzisolibacter propanilivorax]SDM09448.1 methyl-accepting chemotaxis protein [Oryzisolibacter propanilivorax]
MKNLSIGTRLAAGFALVLLLMACISGFGVWRLQTVAQASAQMTQQPLAMERMISDWFRYVSAAARRTSAIVKSSDPSLVEFFKADTAMTTSKAAELQKRIEALLDSPEEKALWSDIQQARTQYLNARDQAVQAKAEGRTDEAERLLEQTVQPATAAYIDQIQRLLDLQRARIDATAQGIQATYEESRWWLLALGLLALAAGALCAWRLTRGITRPLAQAVQVARAVAANDLTTQVQVHGSDETGQLLQALHDMNASLTRVVAQVRTGAEGIATASSQIDAGNQDLSARTEEQASSLQQTAASMEQLTGTVRQNADNARQANQLAASAAQTAAQGGQVVAGVVQTMGAIHDASRRMADIIGVIDSIAFQTNILALNAAVEAARAGEQGRGFAVVAAEVRQLAQRSAAAAKDIKTLIDDSVAQVGAGTQQVDEAGRTMQTIVSNVQRVSDLVAEITAASQEQSSGIDQVHQAVTQMDQVTQQNAALVEEAAAATGALKAQAGQLAAAVSVFRIEGGQAPAAAAAMAATMPAAPRRQPATAPRPAPAPKAPVASAARPLLSPTSAPAAASARRNDDDWESF